MPATAALPSEMILEIRKTIDIDASPDVTFDALLEQLGPHNEAPGGDPMPMKIEAWPGGRWFRDLGGDDGHFWAHVQVIRRGALLELTGPMFMSYPAVSHVQYRLEAHGGGTRLSLVHRAIGLIDPAHRDGVDGGWSHLLECVKRLAAGA